MESIWCAFAVDGDGKIQVPGSATRVTVKTATPQSYGTCDAHVVVPVDAGSHTVTIMGFYDSLINTEFSWGTASALFVAFGGTGSQPVDFDIPAPTREQMP